MFTGSASAASYSDADGDYVCEPGEEITFEGDISYIDEEGIEHWYDIWYWDLDGDGVYESNGRVQTVIFEDEGTYTVALYEINNIAQVIDFEIEIEEEHQCKYWDKIKRFMKEHPENKNKEKWIMHHMEKLREMDKCDCL
jgi:hypothetical protein